MRLYIMRHGETSWNKVRRLQGQTNIPLNEKGIALAKETGKGLRDVPFDLIISSPLDRAVMTAKLATENKDIPIITDERIQEISFGEWEGECTENIENKAFKEYMDGFWTTPLVCGQAPGGETMAQVRERTADFYRSLRGNPEYQDKTILISTHGAASRCFLCNFYEDKDDIWRGCVPPNCAVTIVDIDENGKTTVVEKDKIYY